MRFPPCSITVVSRLYPHTSSYLHSPKPLHRPSLPINRSIVSYSEFNISIRIYPIVLFRPSLCSKIIQSWYVDRFELFSRVEYIHANYTLSTHTGGCTAASSYQSFNSVAISSRQVAPQPESFHIQSVDLWYTPLISHGNTVVGKHF